jgi:hypothetical protein
MDSQEVVKRFEDERQALALMEHPNIAGVLDAGATAPGRPYFVMELVRGQTITRYCDERRLTIRDRLELFIPVCQAVQHAHQKSILHRDLKPSNILVAVVDGRPVPKVIDFGIAKALGTNQEGTLRSSPARTVEGMVIGTPQYMSPEQAGATPDLDTRSDVYTLGVILFELLTGRTPLGIDDLGEVPFDEMLRLIRDRETERPSSRLAPVSEAVMEASRLRGAEPGKLRRLLNEDLDWIVLRALEKERARRYGSAADLAADIQRHLESEPVQARPPSAMYRFGKLARRNRLAFASTAGLLLILAAGVALSTWQAARATKAERRAVEAKESLAVQAGAAYSAMAGEKLKAGEWPDALASLAASLRVNPRSQATYQRAYEEVFQKRAFCLENLLAEEGKKTVLASYPYALVERDRGLQWLEHQMYGGSESHVWLEVPAEPETRASDDFQWLASPGGRYRIELHPERLVIHEKAYARSRTSEVPLGVFPYGRKTGFSADGFFLAISSPSMTQVVDLRRARVSWEFNNPAEVSHLAVFGHGDRVAVATRPLPIGPSRTFKELHLEDGRMSDINTDGGACLMAAACPDMDVRVQVVMQNLKKKVLDIRTGGESGTLDLSGEVLALHLSPETGCLTFLELENDRNLRLGRVNLQSRSKHIEWLHAYEASDGMYWVPRKECYGFALGGKLCLVTARHLKHDAGDSLLCFDLKHGGVVRRDLGGIVARISPARDAAVALVTCLPLKPEIEHEEGHSFTKTDLYLFDCTDPGPRHPPLLEGVRVGGDMTCALSPDGKVFAIAGPYPEQVSVHSSSEGTALGFVRLTV